jgi:hypothetical protein
MQPIIRNALSRNLVLALVTLFLFYAPDSRAEGTASWPPGVVMRFLDDTGAAGPLDLLGLRLWGFVEPGFIGRLTGGQDPIPFLGAQGPHPNSLHLYQLWWTVDRAYNKQKRFDLGLRFDGLFGRGAEFSHSNGLLENSGHRGSDAWFDIIQTYIQLWCKTGAHSGLEILAGKFSSPIGYEATAAAENLLFTHGFLSQFCEPFAHTGVQATYFFSPQLSLFIAPVEGWDVFKDNNHAWTIVTGGTYSSKDCFGDTPRTSLTLNFDVGPEMPDNTRDYLTLTEIILQRWWTPQLLQVINFDIGSEQHAVDGKTANWAGIADYFSYILNDYAQSTIRLEWFRDVRGVFSGIPGNYFDITFGTTLTPVPHHDFFNDFVIRPEFRWDFSDARAFGGGRRYQLTLGFDTIYTF